MLVKLSPGQLWQAGEGSGRLLLGALQVVLVVGGAQVPRVAVASHQVVEMGGSNVEGPSEEESYEVLGYVVSPMLLHTVCSRVKMHKASMANFV